MILQAIHAVGGKSQGSKRVPGANVAGSAARNSQNDTRQRIAAVPIEDPRQPFLEERNKDSDSQRSDTLPKFNSSPLKKGGWKTIHSYWVSVTFHRRTVKLWGVVFFDVFLYSLMENCTCYVIVNLFRFENINTLQSTSTINEHETRMNQFGKGGEPLTFPF